MNKNVKVFSVFAGLGKTTLSKKYKNVVDLDISHYKYVYPKNADIEKLKASEGRTINSDFPNNYLRQLKKIITSGEYEVVLVPADEEIRNLLYKNNISFVFLIPCMGYKSELIRRYKSRGNNKQFIERAIKQLELWNSEILTYKYKTIVVSKNKYLEDILLEYKII